MRSAALLRGVLCRLSLIAMTTLARAGSTDRTGSGVAWLGVSSQTLTSELRDGIKYNGDGLLVSNVVSDSPAEKAGLKKGDVIVSLGTRTIKDPDELADVIHSKKVGDTI